MKTNHFIGYKKLALIGVTANVIEWYDFSIFGYLLSTVGALFFDEKNAQLALIKALFLFSISFLIRPLGSLFFGYMADQYGRRMSLNISLLLMTVPTVFIGALPTYSDIGAMAWVLLLFLRVIQGFAAGGELPTSMCYLYEASPSKMKNLFCSLPAASSMFGVFLGSLIAFFLNKNFSRTEIMDWAWRLPFLLSIFLLLIIFIIRKSIVETNQFKKNNVYKMAPFLKLLSSQKNQLLHVFSLNAFVSVAFYLLFVWMPSYLSVFLNIPEKPAFFINSCGLLTLIVSTLLVGAISKDNHRIKLILYGTALIIIFSCPLFLIINKKSLLFILIAQMTFAVFLGLIDGVINATINSLFDDKVRCTGVSIGFTFSTAIFGGLSPTICSILTHQTGLKLSPVLFLMFAGAMSIFSIIKLSQKQSSFLCINDCTT